MGRTIHVPPGEAGDEIVVRLLPQLWRIGVSKQRQERGEDGA